MKISPKSLKKPGGFGGSDQKNFFQKVITHQDATFLGQKFFSKTNILGSQFFPDPLGLKIWKTAKTGHYGPLVFVKFFFPTPATYWSRKIMGNKVQGGGCIWILCKCSTTKSPTYTAIYYYYPLKKKLIMIDKENLESVPL